jgi:hypothetical protein
MHRIATSVIGVQVPFQSIYNYISLRWFLFNVVYNAIKIDVDGKLPKILGFCNKLYLKT